MKSRFWKSLLEINDVSFKYYLGTFLVLLVLDIFKEGFVFKYFHFPLWWLLLFVIATGLVKLFFNLDKAIQWSSREHFFSLPWLGINIEIKWQKGKFLRSLLVLRGIKNYFFEIFQEFKKSVNSIFSFSLILYLILLLAEQFKSTKFVQENLFFEKSPIQWFLTPETARMNLLLGLVIFLGVVSVLLGKKEQTLTPTSRCGGKDYLFIGILGLIGAYLIYFKTKELGWISYIISVISGLLIILLSVIIMEEDDADNKIP